MKAKKLHAEEEKILWNKFRAGERTAFATLTQAYYRDLFGYATKFTKDKEFIKDCLQELFLDMWKIRFTLSDTPCVKAYLFKSIRHKIHRELYKKQQPAFSANLQDDYCFDVEFSVEQLLIREQTLKETTEKLAAMLNQLPRRQKEIIYLRFFQELEVEQIVQIMEIHPQSA